MQSTIRPPATRLSTKASPEQGVRWGTREHFSLPYLSVNLNALKLLPFPTAQQGDAQMCLETQTRIKTLREHQCKPGSKVAREG